MIAIPEELLEQVERGNVLLLVGEGINRGALPSSEELTQALASRCDYPPDEAPTLPRVAGFFEMMRGRQGLVRFLLDLGDSKCRSPTKQDDRQERVSKR